MAQRAIPEAHRRHALDGAGRDGRQLQPAHPCSSIDDDLSALARTFNRLFDRIEKLLIANRRVSADIAHDLRKPLAKILRRLQNVQADGASLEQARAAAQATIGEIEEVLEMFDALLRIGEVEAGARRAAFRPLDLAAAAREVVEAFEPAAQEEGKSLINRLDERLPIAGDKELLTQMIANLLDNAFVTPRPACRSRSPARASAMAFLCRSRTTARAFRLRTCRRSSSPSIAPTPR